MAHYRHDAHAKRQESASIHPFTLIASSFSLFAAAGALPLIASVVIAGAFLRQESTVPFFRWLSGSRLQDDFYLAVERVHLILAGWNGI